MQFAVSLFFDQQPTAHPGTVALVLAQQPPFSPGASSLELHWISIQHLPKAAATQRRWTLGAQAPSPERLTEGTIGCDWLKVESAAVRKRKDTAIRMARQGREARAKQRRQQAALKLVAGGAVLLLVPLFASGSPFGKALSALFPLGVLMLLGGAAFFWLLRRGAQDPLPKIEPSGERPIRPPAAAVRIEPQGLVDPMDLPIRPDPTAIAPRAPPAKPTHWSKAVFDAIEWRRFEAVVEALFVQAGFETKTQSHGADQGIDIWLYSNNAPGEPVALVQCKHWIKRVGVDKIRELLGVMTAHNVKRGQFATTSSFTEDAVEFARANAINLLDVETLLGLIARRTPDQQQELLAVALEGDYWRPTCVNCGQKMVERQRKSDGVWFWACSKYGCKTMPMRSIRGSPSLKRGTGD